jgi:ABC-type uncharacterized transport system auxiliary subunit
MLLRVLFAGPLLLAALLLAGCFAPVTDSKYYLLNYVPTPPEARLAKGAYPFSVRVRDFEVAEVYRRSNIVYRLSPYELRFYNYDIWAVKPEYMLSDMLHKHVDAARLFTSVRRSLDMLEPDFELQGTLLALEEYDNNQDYYAHLAVGMSLVRTRDKTTVWTREWDKRDKVPLPNPEPVVRKLSSLLEMVNDEAMAAIDSVLALQAPIPAEAAHAPQPFSGNLPPPR